jgi:hypothetical protein
VPIPAHSPNCNPHAERFVKTIRTECLDEFVIFGERHLRYLVGTFVDHYLTGRYHQGLGGQLIRPPTRASNDNAMLGPIRCRSRLGPESAQNMAESSPSSYPAQRLASSPSGHASRTRTGFSRQRWHTAVL